MQRYLVSSLFALALILATVAPAWSQGNDNPGCSTGSVCSVGSLNVTGSTAPTNGMYLLNAETLAFSLNGSEVAAFLGPNSYQPPFLQLVWGSNPSWFNGVGIYGGDNGMDVFRASAELVQFNGPYSIFYETVDLPSSTVGSGTATTSTGELALTKETASGTAPGAGYLKISAVAGTNSGTCKIIAYAGTSTTPVTIIDNVGSGC